VVTTYDEAADGSTQPPDWFVAGLATAAEFRSRRQQTSGHTAYHHNSSGAGGSVEGGSAAAQWGSTDHDASAVATSGDPPARITFIVPSVGRSTLGRTLRSLLAQTVGDWRAIVVLDGVKAPVLPEFDDPRVTVFAKARRVGVRNHAGQVRNWALALARTEWVAFVDDDDVVTPDYVSRWCEERLAHTDAEVVIFRMWQYAHKVLPPLHHTDFRKGAVGISFAMRRALCATFPFRPSASEDFDLLNRMRAAGVRVHLSRHATYVVRACR
jgi:glycosyltransferase involved in cell wall biosynthesis